MSGFVASNSQNKGRPSGNVAHSDGGYAGFENGGAMFGSNYGQNQNSEYQNSNSNLYGSNIEATLVGSAKDEYNQNGDEYGAYKSDGYDSGYNDGHGGSYGTGYDSGTGAQYNGGYNENQKTLKCWRCNNMLSFEDCAKYGFEETCQPNQVTRF